MSGYTKSFDEIKCTSSRMEDDELLGKYDYKISDKVSNSIKKGYDNETVYNGKYLKTKTKFYSDKINTIFHTDKVPKEDSHCIYWSIILIESAFKASENYYLKVFLEECKYIVTQEKKINKYINNEIFSNDSDKEDSAEEISDAEENATKLKRE